MIAELFASLYGAAVPPFRGHWRGAVACAHASRQPHGSAREFQNSFAHSAFLHSLSFSTESRVTYPRPAGWPSFRLPSRRHSLLAIVHGEIRGTRTENKAGFLLVSRYNLAPRDLHPRTTRKRVEERIAKYHITMHKCLEYELAPYPLSLFDEGGMRKGRKSSFYDNFSMISVVSRDPNDFGDLTWDTNKSIDFIIKQYVDYTTHNYS